MPRYEEIPFVNLGAAILAQPTVQPTMRALMTPSRAAALKSMKSTAEVMPANIAIPSQKPLMPVRPQSLPPLATFRTPEGTSIPIKPAVGPLPPDPVRALIPKGITFPSGKPSSALPNRPTRGISLWPKREADGSIDSTPLPTVTDPSYIQAESSYASSSSSGSEGTGYDTSGGGGGSPFLTPEENGEMPQAPSTITQKRGAMAVKALIGVGLFFAAYKHFVR